MSGMDMMVNALLKATGINPAEIMQRAEQVLVYAKNKVDELDTRLRVMEKQLAEIHAATVRQVHAPEAQQQPGESE